MGRRGRTRPEQLNMYLNAGYTVVSIDYRLAPETKIQGIIEDVQDAYKWVREQGPELLRIDPDRVAVIGHSAGGYLTLMAGFSVEPRPRALVSFFGYGDIVGDWLSSPSDFYLNNHEIISKQTAYNAVGGEIISNDIGQGKRGSFYLYCRQNGLWPKEVTGYDPDAEPEAFKPFCPIQNVDIKYPSTMLLHGDVDTDVPYQQSVMMAEELARVGVEHELITIPNGRHGFDRAGMEDPKVASALEKVMTFLEQHTQ